MTTNDQKLEDRIAAMKERFEFAPQRARDERDAELRAIAEDFGLRQVDLINKTGYSRETVRQALNPQAREAVKASRKIWSLTTDAPIDMIREEMHNERVSGGIKPAEGGLLRVAAGGDAGYEQLDNMADALRGAGYRADIA